MANKKVFLLLLLLWTSVSNAQQSKLQLLMDSMRVAGNFPGLSAAIVYGDGNTITLSSGFNDKELETPLTAKHRMMQGSVGKTYVAALAMELVKNGKLSLDDRISEYLGRHDWFKRIPNAQQVTVRMIMNHTSGVMRYEFKEQFSNDLASNPDKHWQPEELLSYILDEKASFPAGEGWEYSDTNYILLGMIIESITGMKYYDLLKQKILVPFKLVNTVPSESRIITGLAQGYAGENKEFGGKDKVIGEDGKFIINPQFEWTGGGVYSTTEDLAKWGMILYGGRFIDTSMINLMIKEAVPAKLGKGVKYGLGVIVRQTPMGTAIGHSGFFPGYMTELLYFPDQKISVALQTNSSDFRTLKGSLLRTLIEIAREATN